MTWVLKWHWMAFDDLPMAACNIALTERCMRDVEAWAVLPIDRQCKGCRRKLQHYGGLEGLRRVRSARRDVIVLT